MFKNMAILLYSFTFPEIYSTVLEPKYITAMIWMKTKRPHLSLSEREQLFERLHTK